MTPLGHRAAARLSGRPLSPGCDLRRPAGGPVERDLRRCPIRDGLPPMWTIPLGTTREEALAVAVVQLAAPGGMEAVTVRAVARQARTAAGTITNVYATKAELLGVCTSVIGRWLAWATVAHLDERGVRGLFPEPDDVDYRALLVVWAQLEALALTRPPLDARVRAMNTLVRESITMCLAEGRVPQITRLWAVARGLQAEVLRTEPEIGPGEATRMLLGC